MSSLIATKDGARQATQIDSRCILEPAQVTNVGEVHTSGSSAAVEDVQKVGEVHADHSQKQQMLQWQERSGQNVAHIERGSL